MSISNLSPQYISQSFQNLVQIDTNNGKIYNGSGTQITTLALTGSLNVSGSTNLNNILTLIPRTTTPTQATTTTGSIMMSGSAGNSLNLYIYTGAGTLGTGWAKITIT